MFRYKTIIGRRLQARTGHLIEQVADLTGVIDIVCRQVRRDDLARLGIHPDMELPPGAACPRAVLLKRLLAGAAELQPSAATSRCTGGTAAGPQARHAADPGWYGPAPEDRGPAKLLAHLSPLG